MAKGIDDVRQRLDRAAAALAKLGVHYAVIGGNAVGIRQKINVIKGLGVEVNGAVRVPQPTATYTYDGGSLSIGEGAFELHVQEVNGILRIGY